MRRGNRGFKVIAIITLIVAVGGLSIAYAGFTSTLTINGTASVTNGWKIVWDDLSSGTATGYASTTGKTLAINSTKTGISGSMGTLQAPGDTITYSWNIENQGEINAVLAAITKGTITCAPAATDGATSEEASTVCSKLSMSYTYDGTTVPSSGITGLTTTLNKNDTIPVTMTLTYSSASTTQLSGGVTVTISTTSFTYNQST